MTVRLNGPIAALLLFMGLPAAAQTADENATSAETSTTTSQAPAGDELGSWSDWMSRVHRAQDSQPHWMTPIATVTPRLEQEFRYDFGFQQAGNGSNLDNYGMGKGLELIPTTTNEILLNIPPYEVRSKRKPAEGFGDDPFLVVKQRLLSANEQNGNYIVTAFLGVQAPTGVAAFTNDAWVITPTIAAGKGWGRFDVQGTFGVAVPLAHASTIGDSEIGNVAFQYHLGKVFWPEFEVNVTHWSGGERDGKTQVYLTPGVIFGRFPISGRLRAIVGVGYQFAVSPKLVTAPALTPQYDRQLILTTRLAF